MYQDGAVYKDYAHGPNVENHHVVLQRLTKDIVIVQTMQRYPSIKGVSHVVALVFKVETSTGFTIGVQAIPSPDLHRAMQRLGLVTVKNRVWLTWAITERDEHGRGTHCETSLNGYISATHRSFARRWLAEKLISIVRTEAKLVDRGLGMSSMGA